MTLSLPAAVLSRRARRSYVRPPAPLHFPEEELLGESREHRMRMNLLFESARREFAGRAIVASDQFVYWDPTNPGKRLAPDLAVRLAPPVERLPSWMIWKLGAPEVGVEVVSDADRAEGSFERKLERYRQAGILEVVRFDDLDREQPLRLWDLFDGDLVERELGSPEALHCDALELYWFIQDHAELGPALRLSRDAGGRDMVLTPEEAALAGKTAALADREAAVAEKDAALAEKDAALAEKDAALAEKDAAFARIAELEKKLRGD